MKSTQGDTVNTEDYEDIHLVIDDEIYDRFVDECREHNIDHRLPRAKEMLRAAKSYTRGVL